MTGGTAPAGGSAVAAGRGARATGPDAHTAGAVRWLSLVVISLAQLMVALDATIINIALPSAQHALHVSDPGRQWVITAYTLAFGGLLLLGGRLADTFGRRRVFLGALAGFAAASAAGGAAPGFGPLLAARAAQGAFAALLAPTVLSLLALTFTEPRDRAKAFAVFGAIVGTGGAVGLLAGGALTEYAQWRWCLFVNVPIAVAAFIGGSLVLPAMPGRVRSRLDVPGALLVTAGFVAVVYGFSQAVPKGWASAPVTGFLIGGVGLLAVFVLVESRVRAPLLPMRIVLDRNRGGSCLTVALTVVGLYGMFLFLTYYFQVVLRYSPARAGLAFLPMSAAVLFSSTVIARGLMPRVPPRLLIVPGLLAAAAGMATLTRLQVDASYVSHILPGELLLGLGLGCVFVPAISTATSEVGPGDAGVASATANAAQQVGASVGTALLNTVAASTTAAYLATRAHGRAGGAAALVHGSATASVWAAGILVAAAAAAGFLIDAGKPTRS
ncbi:MAG: DHA2 family efflux MFS transporter permease subunit [Micromonosporaceae bacterium]